MFLKDLEYQIMLLDGAMGTMIQKLNLDTSFYGGESFKMLSDIINFSTPSSIKEIHLDFLKAGANIIETNTFGSSYLRLSEFDFSKGKFSTFKTTSEALNINDYKSLSYELSLSGAKISKEAVSDFKKSSFYDKRPLYVAGSIGPSNYLLTPTSADLKKGSFDEVEENFYIQARGLIEGGVDIILIETGQDPLEIKATIFGVKKAFKEMNVNLPIMAQVSVNEFGKMPIFNTDLKSVYATIKGVGIDVFGINCFLEPSQMLGPIKHLSSFSNHFISVVPNAGQPENINGKLSYFLEPEVMAKLLKKYVSEFNVNIVGGCCGTTPAHIKALSNAIKGLKPLRREKKKEIYISGPQEAVLLDSRNGLIMIGERINVRGSKKVRDAVENSERIDYEVLKEILNDQTRDLGLSILDVCMDSNLIKTEELLPQVIYNLIDDFKGALCIDSFSMEAIENALKSYAGRPIINSISLENVKSEVCKLDLIVEKTKDHDPLYIALTVDENGPATTSEKKVFLAKKIVERCENKYGVSAANIIIDIGAFPIGSESRDEHNFALESLNSISGIKALHPCLMTSIGVGNLTSGLSQKPYMRKVLTSVFLDEALKKGLDAAIINPNHYVPVESLNDYDVKLAKEIIFNHNMDAFSELEDIALSKKGKKNSIKNESYTDLLPEERVCLKIKNGFKKKEEGLIHEGKFSIPYNDAIVKDVFQSIKSIPPLDFIENYLLKTIKEIGALFGKGEISLPQLLKSADLMKISMKFLEQYISFTSHKKIEPKGIVVIGTVWQDIHSIGKDLVKTLLENYGYKVIDLGVQVKNEDFVKAVKKHRAVAVGLSALLVQTANHMKQIANDLAKEGINIPVLIGGAAVNERHAFFVAKRDEAGSINSNIFYCKNAMDAVDILDKLSDEKKHKELLTKNLNDLKRFEVKKSFLNNQNQFTPSPDEIMQGHIVNLTKEGLFELNITLGEVREILNAERLFSQNWGFVKKESNLEINIKKSELESLKNKFISEGFGKKWFKPCLIFGIYPAISEGDILNIYDSKENMKVMGKILFSSKATGPKKTNIANYFFNKESGKVDICALMISSVIVNKDVIHDLKNKNDMETIFLIESFAARLAEDIAEFGHNHIRTLLEYKHNEGKRFSPGYPLINDLKNNGEIFKILKADRLGISLTPVFAFSPTSTTSAVVCFNKNL